MTGVKTEDSKEQSLFSTALFLTFHPNLSEIPNSWIEPAQSVSSTPRTGSACNGAGTGFGRLITAVDGRGEHEQVYDV